MLDFKHVSKVESGSYEKLNSGSINESIKSPFTLKPQNSGSLEQVANISRNQGLLVAQSSKRPFD